MRSFPAILGARNNSNSIGVQADCGSARIDISRILVVALLSCEGKKLLTTLPSQMMTSALASRSFDALWKSRYAKS